MSGWVSEPILFKVPQLSSRNEKENKFYTTYAAYDEYVKPESSNARVLYRCKSFPWRKCSRRSCQLCPQKVEYDAGHCVKEVLCSGDTCGDGTDTGTVMDCSGSGSSFRILQTHFQPRILMFMQYVAFVGAVSVVRIYK